MAYKLDIFAVLGELAKGNTEYYRSLPEDLQKSIAPFVLFKWGKGATIDRVFHIIALNEYVNQYLFPLGHEKELLWKLLCVALEEPGCRFKYLDKGKGKSNKPITVKVIQEYYDYPEQHAEEAVRLLSMTDILEMAEEQGRDIDEIKTIRKEWE